jgi:type I restriction enzyme S subunit
MKNGWRTLKLAEVADSISTGPFGSMLHKSDYVIDGIPLVNPVNIVDSRIVPSSKMMIGEETRNRLSKYILRKGDIVVGRRGDLGRCAVVTEKEDGWLCGTGSCFIRLSKKMDERFFALYFSSGPIRRFLEESSVGTTMSNLNHGILNELPVPLPPPPEQRRIVGILDGAFTSIATAKANAEKNLQNARGLFESHLNAVFAQRGKGWTDSTLGEVCENLDSKRIPITKSDRAAGEFPYYGASGIVDYVSDYIFDEDLLLVSEDGANLLARTYPIAFSVSGKVWVNNHAHVLRFSDLASQRFVEFYLNSITLRPYVSGMAQPKLNQKSLNSILVPSPPLAQREAIVSQLDSLRDETKRLESIYQRKRAMLDELKKSLLHQAFSGEL